MDVLAFCKDAKSVGGDDHRGRPRHAMQRRASGPNLASIAGRPGVHPVVVNVAVEDFEPTALAGEADFVVPPGLVAEIGNEDDIAAKAFEPAVEGDDAIVVMGVE